MDVSAIATPALLVDRDRLVENINSMASFVTSMGVGLRPHVKTHKCREIAWLQAEAGVEGFTVSTVREAEAMVTWGHDDLLLAFAPIPDWRTERLESLARQARLSFVVDSMTAARAVDRLASRIGGTITCLWEVDCGARRCGTPPGRPSAQAAAEIARLPGVSLEGFFTFPGHVYMADDADEISEVARREEGALRSTVEAADEVGLGHEVLSAGTTPTARRLHAGTPITEIRPGNYVFFDATQVALGVATPSDCALTVLTTVVSRPTREQLVTDAGSKSLGRETPSKLTRGFGVVVGHPELTLQGLYEEHAILSVSGETNVKLGDPLQIVPNHACVAVNLHDRYLVVSDQVIVDSWEVAARGWGSWKDSFDRRASAATSSPVPMPARNTSLNTGTVGSSDEQGL